MSIDARVWLVVASAPSCFSGGPDPGSEPGQVRTIWSVAADEAASGTYIGAAVADETDLYAFVERAGNPRSRSLFRVPKDGSEPTMLYEEAGVEPADPPRLAADDVSLYWTGAVFETGLGTRYGVWQLPKEAEEGASATRLGEFEGSLLAIAVDDERIYVVALAQGGTYCADYNDPFSSGGTAGEGYPTSGIYALDRGGGEPLTLQPDVRPACCGTTKTCLAVGADDLFWFEAQTSMSSDQSWNGGSVVKMPKAGGALTTLGDVPADARPAGLVIGASSVVWSLGLGQAGQGAYSGCALYRAEAGEAAVEILHDDSLACRDLALDDADAYYAIVRWQAESDSGGNLLLRGVGLGRVAIEAGTAPAALPLARADLAIRRVEVDATDVFAFDTYRVLRVPKDTLPW